MSTPAQVVGVLPPEAASPWCCDFCGRIAAPAFAVEPVVDVQHPPRLHVVLCGECCEDGRARGVIADKVAEPGFPACIVCGRRGETSSVQPDPLCLDHAIERAAAKETP